MSNKDPNQQPIVYLILIILIIVCGFIVNKIFNFL